MLLLPPRASEYDVGMSVSMSMRRCINRYINGLCSVRIFRGGGVVVVTSVVVDKIILENRDKCSSGYIQW